MITLITGICDQSISSNLYRLELSDDVLRETIR